jgi:hypothetical protein
MKRILLFCGNEQVSKVQEFLSTKGIKTVTDNIAVVCDFHTDVPAEVCAYSFELVEVNLDTNKSTKEIFDDVPMLLEEFTFYGINTAINSMVASEFNKIALAYYK